MPPRAWKILSAVKAWDWTTWLVVTFFGVAIIYNLLGLGTPAIRDGAECGPNHHWVYLITNVAGGDLSCEMDRD